MLASPREAFEKKEGGRTKERCIVIPAVKKNVAFVDDLVKKLNGRILIQWTIDRAKELAPEEDIYVVTDSHIF